jgi:hypothetical protein
MKTPIRTMKMEIPTDIAIPITAGFDKPPMLSVNWLP